MRKSRLALKMEGPQAKECRQPLETGKCKHKKRFSLDPLERNTVLLTHGFSPVTFVLDFSSKEPWDNSLQWDSSLQ